MRNIVYAFSLCLLSAQAQNYTYTTNNGAIIITGYTNSRYIPPAGPIPSAINGLPVTSIGDNALASCEYLTSVTVPNSVTNIGNSAFSGSYNLTNLTIGTNVTSIGDGAFEDCGGLRGSIGLTSVTIPNSVTRIGNDAFASCPYLTNVTIGKSVTYFGPGAFYGTGLTSATIPSGVTYFGELVFYNCTSLTAVYFQGNLPDTGHWFGYSNNHGTFYYLPGTTGWGATFSGRPVVCWDPQMQPMRTNGFGFTITGNSNLVVVVEASTDMAAWSRLQTNTLTGSVCFNDLQWTNYPARFYRLRWP